MSIRFYCGCGKHLRARDDLAGMRTACPACGQMVGIPSLQPTHRGASAGPVSVEEWEARRRSADAAATDDSAATIETDEKPRRRFRDLLRGKGHTNKATRRRMGALEKRWYQCLVFPWHARHLVLIFNVTLTLMTALAIFNWPAFLDKHQQGEHVWLWWALAPLLVGSYLSGFFHCVLSSAAAGEVGFVRWPGINVLLILRSLLIWLATFLAGPVLFAGAAVLFWFYSGDFEWLDWLIAGELIIVGMGYWLLALVAVHQADRLRDANPQRVAELVRRIGWRILVAAVAASLAVFGHVLAVFAAIEELHRNLAWALVLIDLIWLSGLIWATFFFRLLGLWCYRSRVEAAT